MVLDSSCEPRIPVFTLSRIRHNRTLVSMIDRIRAKPFALLSDVN